MALPIRPPGPATDIVRTLDQKLWRTYLHIVGSSLLDSDLRRREWLILRDVLARPQVCRYLEVGVYRLGCLRHVAQILRDRVGARLVGVDLFDSQPSNITVTTKNQTHRADTLTLAEAESRMSHFQSVRLLAGDSSSVLPNLKDASEKFDVIFIDGNHAYEAALSDTLNAIPLLADSAFLLLHNTSNDFNPDMDYIKKDGGPYRVVAELKERKELEWIQQSERMSLFQLRRPDQM